MLGIDVKEVFIRRVLALHLKFWANDSFPRIHCLYAGDE